ncbi:ABC transporter permease [Oscillatoria amoena NRMC-F 0135]|nr:ABC transporter permease [Oscillatoria amoena NRMC-F 0135]
MRKDSSSFPTASAVPRHLPAALIHPWVWATAWRDSRSQRRRLLIFTLSVVAGVAALTAIHSIKRSVEKAVVSQSKALLGSDLLVSARRALAPEDAAALTARADQVSREISFSSMMEFPASEGIRLVQVRAVDGIYPFYGRIETRPADAWEKLQTAPGVVLEPALLDQYGIRVGDTVRLGGVEIPVVGVITRPAPRSSRFSAFSPEAYLSLETLAATGLPGETGLAFHNWHLRIENPGAVAAIKTDYEERGWRFETPQDRQDSVEKGIKAFQQFLAIIAMVALVLGAIGVASAIRAHLTRRERSIAVLRCLGCPGQAAYAVYLIQSLTLGLLGAVAGGLLGVTLHLSVLHLFRDRLPLDVGASPEWFTALVCVGLGWAVCMAFTLIPLGKVAAVSPAQALRGDAGNPEPLSGSRKLRRWASTLPSALFLGVMLFILAWHNLPDINRAVGMVVGLALALAALAGVARGLVGLSRALVRPGWPYLLRQGLSNLHRPRNQTTLFLFSLGLGSFLILSVLLSRDAALYRISPPQGGSNPNLYLVDVQADQVAGVTNLLESLNLPALQIAPIVTMRITEVKGVPVRELENRGDIPRWILQREFRSSYRDTLNSTETILAGQWPVPQAPGDGTVPLSLENDLARDLGVGVGDIIGIDVQGIPLQARVTSLREVDWSRFNLNFFMIFGSGVLEGAPGFQIVTTRIPPEMTSGLLQRALVRDFPNVSAIDLTLVLETVAAILAQVSAVVQFVVAFTLVAGLAIVTGALLDGRDQRVRESVLLRTLGASSRQVFLILMAEYAALGFFSGLTGVLLAVLAHIPLAVWVFESPPVTALGWWPAAVIGAATLVSLTAGLLLSRGVCTHPPLTILRQETA